jgi:hypothetical protein
MASETIKQPAPSVPMYEFRSGFSSSVSADTIYNRLDYLKGKLSRSPTPRDILDDARHPDSPIHAHFEWDDTVAAEKWRLRQAASLVIAVRVRFVGPDGGFLKPVFHSTHDEEGDTIFVKYEDALEPERREQTLSEVLTRIKLATSRDRHMGFTELEPIYMIVDVLYEKYCK